MGGQYTVDVLAALAERTIKRLWIIILLLVVLLFGSNIAWSVYLQQFQTVTVTQEVEQDADSGSNNFVGGDYIGSTEGNNYH